MPVILTLLNSPLTSLPFAKSTSSTERLSHMPLSTDQISQINDTLLSAIKATIEETLENELDTLDKNLDAWNIADDALTAFEADIDELVENVLETVTTAFGDELAQKTQLAIGEFKATELPSIKYHYEKDGIVDGPARREGWCNLIDAMNRDGVISDVIAESIDADVEAL